MTTVLVTTVWNRLSHTISPLRGSTAYMMSPVPATYTRSLMPWRPSPVRTSVTAIGAVSAASDFVSFSTVVFHFKTIRPTLSRFRITSDRAQPLRRAS